jgi:hypothetical protein
MHNFVCGTRYLEVTEAEGAPLDFLHDFPNFHKLSSQVATAASLRIPQINSHSF